jgi:hypothetical protein
MASIDRTDPPNVPVGTLLRDLVAFEIKLVIDGFKDFILTQVAVVAFLAELIFRKGRRGGLFYGLMGVGRRFEHWLGLYEPWHEQVEKNRLEETGRT